MNDIKVLYTEKHGLYFTKTMEVFGRYFHFSQKSMIIANSKIYIIIFDIIKS